MGNYKIPVIPGSKSKIEELADFWEITAIQKKGTPTSLTNIAHILQIELDEHEHDGITSEGDAIESTLDTVLKELKRRDEICNNHYPFKLDQTSISYIESTDWPSKLYRFLLYATRLNMKDEKVQSEIDATLLFEDLCAQIGSSFLGPNAQSLVFGTANPGSFEDKVNNLVKNIGEGGCFVNRNSNVPTNKDDGIDVVIWRNFKDNRIGKLIAFGQCKTGDSWRDSISKFNVSSFQKKWFHDSAIFTIPLVFLTDTLFYDRNFYNDQIDKIFLNRFRIFEYGHTLPPDGIPSNIINNITTWVEGAENRIFELSQ